MNSGVNTTPGDLENEIKFGFRKMQKGYCDQLPAYQGYYPSENGYKYDPFYGNINADVNCSYYGQSSCAVQNHLVGENQCPQIGDYNDQGYGNPCMQPGPMEGPGVGPMHPDPSSMDSKSQQAIFPWMKESRQNSKQRQGKCPV